MAVGPFHTLAGSARASRPWELHVLGRCVTASTVARPTCGAGESRVWKHSLQSAAEENSSLK